MFPDKLATNVVTVGDVKQVAEKDTPADESESKEPAKPATGDQSRNDLPDDSLMAAADDSLILLAQADTTDPVKPEDADADTEKPAPEPDADKPEDKPAEADDAAGNSAISAAATITVQNVLVFEGHCFHTFSR